MTQPLMKRKILNFVIFLSLGLREKRERRIRGLRAKESKPLILLVDFFSALSYDVSFV
jgi:hypothetical protein